MYQPNQQIVGTRSGQEPLYVGFLEARTAP